MAFKYKNSHLLQLPLPAAAASIYCFPACVNTSLDIPVDQNVVWFQVPVDDVMLVQVLQGQDDFSQVELKIEGINIRANLHWQFFWVDLPVPATQNRLTYLTWQPWVTPHK
jgi:hypothetical protein